MPKNRAATAEAELLHQADMGVAWDGDFDRCFLFDEHGEFIERYYIFGQLAAAFLAKYPNEKIIHDPRLPWNTVDILTSAGSQAIMSKTGDAFIKKRMRAENAIYGGEISAHHYFKDFAYCDSVMISWLLVCGPLSQTVKALSELVKVRIEYFLVMVKLILKLQASLIQWKVKAHFMQESLYLDVTEGLTVELPQWRFNLLGSNTEPLLRLNLESRGDFPIVGLKEGISISYKEYKKVIDDLI